MNKEEWDKNNCIRISVKLNKNTDHDAIEKLKELEKIHRSKNNAIKWLLKNYVEKL